MQRFGKFHKIVDGGLYFTLPFIDTIIEHDMREMTIQIAPQTAQTRDNVSTKLSAVLFVQIVDAKKATYGIRRPLVSVVKAAEAAMRNALGEMELDECFREKDRLNRTVMEVPNYDRHTFTLVHTYIHTSCFAMSLLIFKLRIFDTILKCCNALSAL